MARWPGPPPPPSLSGGRRAAAAERLQLEDARLRTEQEACEQAEKDRKDKADADESRTGAAAEDDGDGDEALSCAGTDDAGVDIALAAGIARVREAGGEVGTQGAAIRQEVADFATRLRAA